MIQGSYYSSNVNSKVIDMEIRLGLDGQEPKKSKSSEIEYSEILKSKRAQIFFIQLPNKDTLQISPERCKNFASGGVSVSV